MKNLTGDMLNLAEFSDGYSRSAAANMLLNEDKTQSVDSLKAENKFGATFTPVAAGGETITTKRNSAFNSGLFKRLNNSKEGHAVSMFIPF